MLRPYQQDAIDQIRAHYLSGKKKVLLHLATGGGKTVVFSYILKTMSEKGLPAIMVVRGRELVDQASSRLIRENVYHGVKMAGHWLKRPAAKVQICSIDTLRARGELPDAKLIVIDEAHMATSKSYRDFLAQYPDAHILAVTATPYTKNGLSHCAEVVVHPITVQELIDKGFLVPARYFSPSSPDLQGVGVSKSTGDYNQDELSDRMNNKGLVGDIVNHWQKLAEDRPTVVFAVSIEHSKSIVASFKVAGIAAEHCDADTSDEDRKTAIKKLSTGELKVISNVGILCTGVDMPHLSCIVMARPTMSYNLFIQQAGRGTRPFPGKSNFLLLDHAGNVLRHGFITEEREVNLEGSKKDKPLIRSPSTCESCFAVFYRTPSMEKCPQCGVEFKTKMRIVDHMDGELTEITQLPKEVMLELEIKRELARLKGLQKERGYKRGWIFFQLKEKYGEEVAERYYPKRFIPERILRSLKAGE